MKAAFLYTGERGAEYYAQRERLRSDSVQRERALLFRDIEDERASILDFGCGNGALLAHLHAATRIGVEISPHAAKEARKKLDVIVTTLADVADSSVDSVISFHALEHVDAPAVVLREMWRVLKPSGQIKLIVPCDVPLLRGIHSSWRPDDINMHLYAWSPQTLGNLLTLCGFAVEDARLLPASAGGRLGRMLSDGNWARLWLSWLKGIRSGRFHTVVAARKAGKPATNGSQRSRSHRDT
jgi:SAM-dependent methyltransferase